MDFASSLDQLGAPEKSPAQRFREALELFEEGVELKRRSLKRQFPEATDSELEAKLHLWLARQDES